MFNILKIFKRNKDNSPYIKGCSGNLYSKNVFYECEGFIIHKATKRIIEASVR